LTLGRRWRFPEADQREDEMLYRLGADAPEFADERHWVARDAVLVGKVRLERDASVWFGAVLRGDNELITVGEGSNVQELCVMHTDPGYPLVIGPHVTVGHMAMLHGCVIGEGSLIGIGAVVLNGAKIGKNCLIGAKALVPENQEIPDNSLVMGIPAKIKGEVGPEHIARMRRGASNYVARWQRFRTDMVAIE
jgi:carbonic anhydrase/acetyltransferase-like protein (isoleucine patch superfamily)